MTSQKYKWSKFSKIFIKEKKKFLIDACQIIYNIKITNKLQVNNEYYYLQVKSVKTDGEH